MSDARERDLLTGDAQARAGSATGTIQRERGIVGRDEELALALAVLRAGRHLLFEGTVGVGKTRVALAVCAHLGRTTLRVDGDDRYSEAKLTGWFDPPLVMGKGYCEETFFAGPLVRAMKEGAVLFVNELNRMPEGVQNVMLPALDEGLLELPRIGEVRAAQGFQVIATQNPAEFIATGRLSEALRDRFEHVSLGYQSAAEEALIVRRETLSDDDLLVWRAVVVTRATRGHPKFKKGASVRAAMALVAMVQALRAGGVDERDALRRAAIAALSTRTEISDEIDADFLGALDDILEALGDLDLAGLQGVAEQAQGLGAGKDEPHGWERQPPLGPRGGAVNVELAMRSCAEEPELEFDPLEYFTDRLSLKSDTIDGWRIAQRMTKPGCEISAPGMRQYAERLAVRAVLERAARLAGPLRGAMHTVVEPLREPHQGDLELDETLDNLIGKEFPEPQDWMIERREERRTQIVLMLDTSLSMAGANIALAAVAAAVMALKMHPEDLAVVVFESKADVISHLEDAAPPEYVVTEMLRQPCRGYTSIEAGLKTGLRELARGRNTRKYGLLITDGVYTRGGDPTPVAAQFPHLFVLLTEDYKMNEMLCRRMAGVGKGELFRVRSLAELPRRMVDVADRLLR
jgi:MoxR-like ATPase/Mg-chelatase subunit ChlD